MVLPELSVIVASIRARCPFYCALYSLSYGAMQSLSQVHPRRMVEHGHSMRLHKRVRFSLRFVTNLAAKFLFAAIERYRTWFFAYGGGPVEKVYLIEFIILMILILFTPDLRQSVTNLCHFHAAIASPIMVFTVGFGLQKVDQ